MRLLSILAGALFFTSCVTSEEPLIPTTPSGPGEGGVAELSFVGDMPAPAIVSTRAVGTIPENRIDDIYVLVFETGTDGDLIYKGKGKNLAVSSETGVQNNNRVTFKATLPVGTAYDFMVLANAEDALGSISVSGGSSLSDVLAITETLAKDAKWGASATAMTPIPMWGELKNRTLTSATEVNFTLTRMLARVNVAYNPTITTDDNFQLTSVRVYNYSKSGALVPAAASLDTDGATSKSPTAPTGGYGTEARSALLYDGTAITGNKACENMIYLFEAAHNGFTYANSTDDKWIDNPCIVVGGKFKADGSDTWSATETFYRIDFIESTEDGDKWLSLLRNFSYNVSITSVGGEGYGDPDVALRSAPFNIEATVLPWNERDGKVVFDAQFYLWVDRDEFVFQRLGESALMADGTNAIKIKTDYLEEKDPTKAGSGWHVDRIVAAGTDNPVTWLKLVPDTRPAGWAPDDIDDAYFTFETNPGPENREADVWIKAGRLEYKIHVVQRILSLDIFDNDTDTPVTEMFFVIPDAGSNGSETREFRVDWTPSSRTVSVANESPVVYNPFDPAWITGSPTLPGPGGTATVPAQPANPVGSVTYRVKPAAVSSDEFTLDPFYERESNYIFDIQNGTDRITKTINLHQIHYALVVDANKYRLDGGTHTVTARSNADWKITKIEEWLYNTDPATLPAGERPTSPVMLDLKTYDNLRVGTEGGPNINGEAVAFTVVNNDGGPHDGKWGTVYVTFESASDPAKFPSQRVAISFPPASRLLMGLGDAGDVRNFNIATSTSYHQNSAFKMLSSPYNFGSMEESVYNVEGLRLVAFNATGESDSSPSNITPDADWHVNSFRDWLNDYNPDVIVISGGTTSSMYFNANELRLLKEYLENGGAVIMCYHSYDGNNKGTANVLGTVFGRSFTNGTNYTSSEVHGQIGTGQYFRLASGDAFADDPILNGPFGDIRGKDWGAHYHTNSIKTSLIAGQATTLSTANDGSDDSSNGSDYSIIFRHNEYNFLFIGNGCAMASYYDYYQDRENYHDPFVLDPGNFYYPKARPEFGPSSSRYTTTYNSFLIANSVAWALTVTNHIPPAGGYVNQ